MQRIPIYIERRPKRRRFATHYFPRMFRGMGVEDCLLEAAPGVHCQMLHILALGSPYRVSQELAEVKGGGMCVYQGLVRRAWKQIEATGGAVLLELLVESFFGRADMVAGLHQGIAEYKLDRRKIGLVNANLASKREYERHRTALGLPEGPKILPFNGCYWLLKGQNRAIPERIEAIRARAAQALRQKDSRERRPKKFISFNGKARPHRLYVIMRLMQAGRLEEGLVSLLAHEPGGLPAHVLAGRIRRYGRDPALFSQVHPFLQSLPLSIDVTQEESQQDGAYKRILPWISQDPAAYDQAYLSVVIDTSFDDAGTLFLTPIAFKPFMNFSPFVYFGNAGAVAEMRALGFRTFSPWIDEAYDEEADHTRRMAAALAELDRLLSLSLDELHQMHIEMWPVLEHNYWHLHDPDARPFLQAVEDQILAPMWNGKAA